MKFNVLAVLRVMQSHCVGFQYQQTDGFEY